MQRASSVYLQTQVTTTSQGDIVIMLYDGALKFLNQAKDFLEQNNMAKKGIAISKALDILNELDSSLNMEKGGEISKNLHSLYIFCNGHLLKANLKKDPAMIDEVIKIITGLREAYAAILTQPEAQAAAQEAAANMRATAIMPPRSQAGTSSTGGATPAPGASARIRAMHAQQARLNAEKAQQDPSAAADSAATPVSEEQAAAQQAAPAATPAPSAAAPTAAPSSYGAAPTRSAASGMMAAYGAQANRMSATPTAAQAATTQSPAAQTSTATGSTASAPAAQAATAAPTAATKAATATPTGAATAAPTGAATTSAGPAAAPQTEQQKPATPDAGMPGFPATGGFGAMKAKSDLYRKFSGQ